MVNVSGSIGTQGTAAPGNGIIGNVTSGTTRNMPTSTVTTTTTMAGGGKKR